MARTEAAPARRHARLHTVKRLALGCVLAGLLCTPEAASASPPASSVAPAPPLTAERKAEGARAMRSAPRLFGTVSFRMSMDRQQNWLDVLKRNAASPIFFDERALSRSVSWGQFRRRLEGRPLREKLREVNRFWNAWPYRSDREAWSREDYWAAPAEFLDRSGDCEDFCIAKYFTLRALGIPADDMRIVVVKETIRGIGHAVLAVFEREEVHILDNLSDSVRPMRLVRNYVPHVSVNENGRWMHVKAKPARAAGSREEGYGTQQ